MPAPIFYGVNRLETSTVTAATTLADRPVTRLSDRFLGPLWQGTGPVVWDQGAGTPGPFDAVLVGAGHTLQGATLTVETAPDAAFSAPTVLGTATPASADALRIPCTGTVARYSRLVIAGGPSPVAMGELWASVGVATPEPPLFGTSPNALSNYTGEESEAGVWMVYVKSAPRWQADWDLVGFDRPARDAFLALFQAIQGGRPFFVVDDEGVLRFARWVNAETTFTGLLPKQYQTHMQLREVGA
jgi:hypothetical protein